MAIVFYNSLTKRKEEFSPLREKEVRMYTCGPTVYDYPHIGHGRTYSVWDTLVRYLEYKGFEVYHVQNITDVGHLTGDADFGEDKIIKRALEKKMEPMVLVERMVDAFFKDMAALGVRKADLHPRAAAHIPEIIEVVKKILENGYAYVANGSVYFDIEKYMEKYVYPEFIDLSLEELEKTERIPEIPEKRNKWDFALWKKAEPGHILQWPSPWGYGYPGWHIECTVMSAKYLGEEFDIHGGGEDLKFPHHSNERAQSFAAFGKGLARYWLHTGFVKINGEKMSKSTGNFVYLKDAISEWGGQVIRFWAMSAHYRKQVDYTEKGLENARNSLRSLLLFVQDLEEAEGGQEKSDVVEKFVRSFENAMDDDLDTQKAIKAFFNLKNEFYAKKLFNRIKKEDLDILYKKVVEFGRILGLVLDAETERAKILSKKAKEVLKILVDLREELRKKKEYDLSDKIREALSSEGIEILDTPAGPRVRVRE